MWTNRNVIIGIFLLLFTTACSTTKTVSTTGGVAKELSKKAKRDFMSAISANKLQYETFSTKAKTKLTLDNKSFNSTLNIRIKNNETIWISATAFLGIEAARIMITPDRIQIINRLQSTYIDKPFEYIYNYTARALTFNELEDLLIGNAMAFYDDEVNQILALEDSYLIMGQLENLDFEMKFGENYSLKQTKLSEESRSQRMQIDYKNFAEVEAFEVPKTVNISLVAKKADLNAEMEYEDIRFNKDVEFPFSVPTRYKRL